MRSWEDLSDLEQAANIYSDIHKDAYGFRPRAGGVHSPVTLADYDAAFTSMQETLRQNEEREAAFEARALARFEAEVAALIADHGIDHATALRWWFEAEGFQPRDHAAWSRQEAESTLYGRGIAMKAWPAIIDAFLLTLVHG